MKTTNDATKNTLSLYPSISTDHMSDRTQTFCVWAWGLRVLWAHMVNEVFAFLAYCKEQPIQALFTTNLKISNVISLPSFV